ncbi:hypothetical protein J437_LFUL008535, partial [Ladona fulva]
MRGRGGRGGRGSGRGARGAAAHMTSGATIIPKPLPSVVQKVISTSSNQNTAISPSLAEVTAATLMPPSNAASSACLVPVLKQLDINTSRTETVASVSAKEPVKVVMMPVQNSQHIPVSQGIVILPGTQIAKVESGTTAQRLASTSVPVSIAPKTTVATLPESKSTRLAMGSSPSVTTVVMSTHGAQPKVEVLQQPKVCLTNLGDIGGIVNNTNSV